MRLIDADELIKSWKTIPHDAYIFNKKDIIADIKKAPTIELNQWIDVKDKLPEEKEYIDSLNRTSNCSDDVLVIKKDQFGNNHIDIDCTVNGEWVQFIDVLYWMPLPKII